MLKRKIKCDIIHQILTSQPPRPKETEIRGPWEGKMSLILEA